jgi:hypothetical protein
MITFLDEEGSPVYPSHGLPSNPVYPSHGLPGGGHVSGQPILPPGGVTLPVFPFDPTRPDNTLPGSGGSIDNTLPGSGGSIDNSLPRPGKKYVVKWLACTGLILVPDNSLPATPEPK